MLHVVIVTLALVSGECPECDRQGWGTLRAPHVGYADAGAYADVGPRALALVPPSPLIKHPSVLHVIPRPVVRCVGQNCFSVTRPFIPGVPVFDYRKEFNYPWSQAPCALTPPMPAGEPGSYEPAEGYELNDEPEVVPAPQLETRRKARSRGTITARGKGVVVSDQVPTAALERR